VNTAPAIIGALQVTEAIKLIVGDKPNKELISLDIWNGTFDRLQIQPRKDCPACNGRYDFLNEQFETKITSLCGQSRSVQVIDTNVNKISLNELSDKLSKSGRVSYNEFMLNFNTDDKEIIVFPNGRAIIRNTIDESEAKELYDKYIKSIITEII
jgi:adenylyltransferase/sulfurtransferase